MALAIDSSSPAAHVAGVSTPDNQCASFIPPNDSLLLAMWAGDAASGGSGPLAPGTTSTPGQTWTLDGWDKEQTGTPTVPGQAAIFHADIVGTSPGSTSVTVHNDETASTNGSILKVYVITGHDHGDPIGVVDTGRQDGGSALSDSYSASITGGQGFLVVCDWAAIDTSGWTANAGCTIEDKGTVSGEISYAVVRRTSPDGVLGSSTSIGMSGLPAGGKYHWVIAEIISLEAAVNAAQSSGVAGSPNAPMF